MSKNALPILTALTLMTAACASPADEPTADDDDQTTTTTATADQEKQEKQATEADQQATPQWFKPWHFWPRPAPPPPSGGGCDEWECGTNHNRRLVRV